jgi:acetate kinase
MELLMQADNPNLHSIDEIEAVGHRVVHGGELFKDSVLIDEDVESAIEQAFDIAPLHNPPNLHGIRAAKKLLPNIPHVAVFDTAFHHSIPQHAYLYAIPNRLYRRYKIRRYGFHGTSHYFVSREYFNRLNRKKNGSKIISCHLGNGGSINAIKDGKSYDTSMGFTPLEGLVMGTRSGDIDPSILFFLIEKEELSLANVHALLNKHSGLLGLSGYAGDMRDLLEEAEQGDRRCNEAVDVFCYRAKKYIGSYVAALNGADALLFTGGIGENSPIIRKKIIQDLEYLGLEIDEKKNDEIVGFGPIHTENSRVEIYVVPTNEELVIAIDAAKIAIASKQTPWA